MKKITASLVGASAFFVLFFGFIMPLRAETDRVISSLSPASGSPGTQVSITGHGFENDCGSGHGCTMSVGFGEASAQWSDIISWTDTEIVALVPHSAVTAAIRVAYRYDDNGVETGGNVIHYVIDGPTFTVIPTPVEDLPEPTPEYNTECIAITPDSDRKIFDVQPRYGMIGDIVTITGTGFEADCGSGHSCNFSAGFGHSDGAGNLNRADLISWSNEKIVFRVPSGAKSGITNVAMYCDSNGVDQGGENIIQYELAGPDFTVQEPVTQAYGCSYSTSTSDTGQVKVSRLFADGSEADAYLEQVYSAYSSIWDRAPRCDELQFHLDHSTPIGRLTDWLEATPSEATAAAPSVPTIETAIQPDSDDLIGNYDFARNTPIVFGGTAVPGATVTLYFSSEPFTVTTQADDNGVWTYTLTKDLGPGEHTLQTSVTDSQGLVSQASAPYTFRIIETENAEDLSVDASSSPSNALAWWLGGGALGILLLAFVFRKQLL